jgi:uncharacterized membrane protein
MMADVMNPFDWRTVLLAKHAQHVVLIHFPIALYLVGVAVDLIAQRTQRKDLEYTAYLNFAIAAVYILPVAVTGLIAWQWQLEGQALKGMLLYHLAVALASSALIMLTWWLHFYARREGANKLPSWRMPLEVTGVVLLMLTGHLGGFLSGVNGMP